MKKFDSIISIINKGLIIFSMIYFINLFCATKTIQISKTLYTSKADFINLMKDAAIEDMKESGVFASVTLGQAAIESGWGSDSFAIKYNNYFGMKAGSSIYINGVRTTCNASHSGLIGNSNNSNQFWSGMAVCVKASENTYSWFRVYDSVYNSIKDHSRNLWCISDGRYIKNGVFASPDPQTQLYTIAKSGYAVDASGNVTTISGLRYDEYIYKKIIVPNNFTEYDQGYQAVKPDYANNCSTASYEGSIPQIPESGNSFDNYETTYQGDITNGYIYSKQLGKALKKSINDTTADQIESRIDNIIRDIFNNSKYSNTGYNNGSFSIVNSNALNWKQYDPAWGSIRLGNGGETIKSAGCLATSVAIQIKASGTTINMDNFNPGTFVTYLNSNNGFSGSLFSWVGWQGIVPHWSYEGKEVLPSSKSDKINKIKQLLNQGYYPVMCVKRNCGHWVAVIGVSDDNIIIADPGMNTNTVWPTYSSISNDSTLKVAKFKRLD